MSLPYEPITELTSKEEATILLALHRLRDSMVLCGTDFMKDDPVYADRPGDRPLTLAELDKFLIKHGAAPRINDSPAGIDLVILVDEGDVDVYAPPGTEGIRFLVFDMNCDDGSTDYAHGKLIRANEHPSHPNYIQIN